MTLLVRSAVLPDAQRWLEERVADRVLFTGAQVAVVHQGRLAVDLVVGTEGSGRPVRPETQFRVYCAGKPFLAATVCRAAERGLLDRSAPLRRFDRRLDGPAGTATIEDLLRHRTPFTQPTGFGSVFLPPGARSSAILEMCDAAMRSPRRDGYGEVANWHLLAEALASTTGRPWTELVSEHVEEGRLPSAEVSLDAAAFDRSRRGGHAGLNVSMRSGHPMPLLGELDQSLGGRLDGPGFGSACSMRFLSRFLYDSVVLRGYGDRARSAVVASDPTYGRDLTFADGLMVGPDTLGLSDLWPDDVAGHHGIAGMTLAFASRSLELSVAVHLNGMMAPEDGGGYVRPFLTGLLYSELAESGLLD